MDNLRFTNPIVCLKGFKTVYVAGVKNNIATLFCKAQIWPWIIDLDSLLFLGKLPMIAYRKSKGGPTMVLGKWDPLKSVSDLQDRINRLFDESLIRSREIDGEVSLCAWKPSVDIYETDDGFIIEVELPGVNKENVSVEIKDNTLIIKGERKVGKTVEKDKYYRRERSVGTFHRAFTLQNPINPEKINARFRDGVLKVEIPKPEEEKPKQIKISVE